MYSNRNRKLIVEKRIDWKKIDRDLQDWIYKDQPPPRKSLEEQVKEEMRKIDFFSRWCPII